MGLLAEPFLSSPTEKMTKFRFLILKNIGEIYEAQGLILPALDYLVSAIMLQPENLHLWFKIGFLASHQNLNLSLARFAFEK